MYIQACEVNRSTGIFISISQRGKIKVKIQPRSQKGKEIEIRFDSPHFDSGGFKVLFSLKALDIDKHSRFTRGFFCVCFCFCTPNSYL